MTILFQYLTCPPACPWAASPIVSLRDLDPTVSAARWFQKQCEMHLSARTVLPMADDGTLNQSPPRPRGQLSTLSLHYAVLPIPVNNFACLLAHLACDLRVLFVVDTLFLFRPCCAGHITILSTLLCYRVRIVDRLTRLVLNTW